MLRVVGEGIMVVGSVGDSGGLRVVGMVRGSGEGIRLEGKC